jgi:hypothetical protein
MRVKYAAQTEYWKHGNNPFFLCHIVSSILTLPKLPPPPNWPVPDSKVNNDIGKVKGYFRFLAISMPSMYHAPKLLYRAKCKRARIYTYTNYPASIWYEIIKHQPHLAFSIQHPLYAHKSATKIYGKCRADRYAKKSAAELVSNRLSNSMRKKGFLTGGISRWWKAANSTLLHITLVCVENCNVGILFVSLPAPDFSLMPTAT